MQPIVASAFGICDVPSVLLSHSQQGCPLCLRRGRSEPTGRPAPACPHAGWASIRRGRSKGDLIHEALRSHRSAGFLATPWPYLPLFNLGSNFAFKSNRLGTSLCKCHFEVLSDQRSAWACPAPSALGRSTQAAQQTDETEAGEKTHATY
jgi:hypothetical protein